MDMNEQILKIIMKFTDEGIHVIDSNGVTLIYNKAIEELEGMKGSEVVGKKILDVFPSLTENTSTLCKVLKTKQPIIEQYQTYINKTGNKITSVNTTIPILDNEKIMGAVEISKNFTKVKELYDNAISMNNHSKNFIRKDGDFIFDSMIGCSPSFIKCVDIAKVAAKSNSTVLIYGDTGTGKEVFSRAIHNESSRANKPFIPINCAALPEGLLEGILFGTVKGGFTGAVDRPGLFEQADGGTLLLDEINSMSTLLQAKLLRVLQEGVIRRVGGIKDIPVDVRIIATTNEEPYTAIKNGTIRKDLYYRLSVININIPPLRERKEDIPEFIKTFIKTYNDEFSKDVWDISSEVLDAFLSYNWPGNVREMKNYIEGSMNMVNGHILKAEHFTPQVQETLFKKNLPSGVFDSGYDFKTSIDEYINNIEKKIIDDALRSSDGNITKAAKTLKIKRQTLQYKIKKYEIK